MLPIKAHPKAKTNAVTGMHDGRLKVSVTESPERGKANDAIIKLLASALDLSKTQIRIRRGATSPLKELIVSGTTVAGLQARILSLGFDV